MKKKFPLFIIVFLMLIVTACKQDNPHDVELPVDTFDVVGEIEFLQWSPDGTRLAGASQADQLSVWDVESGQLLFSYEFDEWLRGLCWTYDGSQLVAAFESAELIVWDANTGKILHRLSHNVEAWGKPNAFTSVACAPSKPLVVTGQTVGDFVLWDSSDWNQEPTQIETYRWMVDNLVWSSDSAYVGEVHFSKLYLWRLSDYTVIQEMNIVDGKLAFSPDGSSLLVGTIVGSVHKWDVATGKEKIISHGSMVNNHYGGYIVGIGWAKSGQVFATASDNGRIILWENTTDDRLYYLRTPRRITSMTWSPTADVLAMGGRHEIMLMDISELVSEIP